MEKIKVGLIGLYNKEKQMKIFKSFSDDPRVEVTSLSSLKEEDKEIASKFKLKYYSDFSQMLQKEKLDAISISLPSNELIRAVISCINSNVNILFDEIPINIEKAREIAEIIKRKKIIFLPASNLFFNQSIQYMIQQVFDNTLGLPISLFARSFYRSRPLNWNKNKEKIFEWLFISLTPLINISRKTMSSEINKAEAFITSEYTYSVLNLNFLNNTMACITIGWNECPTYPLAQETLLDVIGTDGVILIDTSRASIRVYSEKNKEMKSIIWDIEEIQIIVKHFIELLEGYEEKQLLTIEDEIASLKIIEEAYKNILK
jgi:predicted dehydrogenase